MQARIHVFSGEGGQYELSALIVPETGLRSCISQFLFGKKTRVALPDYIKSVADEVQGVLKVQRSIALELEKLEGMLRNTYSTSREEWLGASNLGAGLFSMDGTKLHAEMKVLIVQ